MRTERFSRFCDNVALDTGTSKVQVGNSMPIPPGDIGAGKPIYCVITASADITLASGTGQLRLWLASDSTPSFTASSATLHAGIEWQTSTTAIPAGTVLGIIALPMGGQDYEGYLGIIQAATTALNAGAIDAFLTDCPPVHKHYPDGAPALS